MVHFYPLPCKNIKPSPDLGEITNQTKDVFLNIYISHKVNLLVLLV